MHAHSFWFGITPSVLSEYLEAMNEWHHAVRLNLVDSGRGRLHSLEALRIDWG